MARTLTPLDGYTIMNALVEQMTGQNSVTATDISSYISAGETVMQSGIENVFNALSIVAFRTYFAVRPYKRKFSLINALDTGAYSSRFRKISFYSKQALPSGYFNTDQFTNLADTFTNGQNPAGTPPVAQSTKSMWEQNQAMPLEMNFGGSTVWDQAITIYENQIAAAMRDPQELANLVSAMITEHENDIESEREAFDRMIVLSKIASIYDYATNHSLMTESKVDLTAAFNAFYSTSYTGAQLRSTYLKEFLAFMVATIKEYSDYLTERGTMYHLPMTKTVGGVNYNILRHTPRDRQRLMLYSPLFRKAESLVLPEIFHDDLLRMDQYEAVSYWQSNASDVDRPAIDIQTSIYDPGTGLQVQGAQVQLDYVIGILYDADSMMSDWQLDSAYTTPIEARKGYRNTWLHIAKNAINDPTENAILFYMS